MRHCICYSLLQLQPMKTTSFITPDLAAVHSLDHHHKVIPEGFNRFNPTFLRIYDRQMEGKHSINSPFHSKNVMLLL